MKKVLIIGAGFLQAYVIRRARELGYYTYAVDGNEAAPGFAYADEYAVINIVDKNACLSYARDKQVDGVLTAATDYGVLTAGYIAEHMGLPGIGYGVAMTVKNKYAVRSALARAHADDTAQAYELADEWDMDAIRDKVHYPVMVKPCDGSGSRSVSKVECPEDLAVACRDAMDASLTHHALVETFIVGREYGAESFVYNGHIQVLAIMRKWMTEAPYYSELGHSIPSRLPADTEAHIRSCVETAIRALNIRTGAVNMDLLLSEDGMVHIVDVGARMGGNLIGSHIVPAGTGIDYMGAMLRAAVGDPIDIDSHATPRCVVTRLLALTPGRVKSLPDFDRIAGECRVDIHHHLSVGDTVREYRTNLDGCGYVVAIDDDYDTALARAEKALCRIDAEIVREQA